LSANDRLLRAFEAHYRTLLTFVRRRTAATSHADAAADIVQDAFLRIATLAAPQQVQQPQAFFRRVVENLMIDRFRERILLPLPLAHEDADDGDCRENVSAKAHRADAPDDLLQAKQTAAAIDRLIVDLPPRCREVFLLRKVDGLTHDEIAERLGISQNMVEKHLRRALMAFQQFTDAEGALR
jgi:RNA polymerase sigma-70 factor (ECF subfamily)